VAHAPTRPPHRTNISGRPPRGPRRVPPKNRRDYAETRALITKAVETLRKNKRNEDLADAVEYTLTPDYVASARYELVEKTSSGDRNLPISCTTAYRQHMREATAAAGTNLTEAITQALTEIADGTFQPAEPTRARHGSMTDQTKTNINTRQPTELLDRAKQRCAQVNEQTDWRLTANGVIKQWLETRYPLSESAAGE
jgi:hypothetical protein